MPKVLSMPSALWMQLSTNTAVLLVVGLGSTRRSAPQERRKERTRANQGNERKILRNAAFTLIASHVAAATLTMSVFDLCSRRMSDLRWVACNACNNRSGRGAHHDECHSKDLQ